LWEYLDWMLSVSSNSAAAMIMRDAMLLRHFGQEYPVSEEQIRAFFDDTPPAELTRLFQQIFWQPVTRIRPKHGAIFTLPVKIGASVHSETGHDKASLCSGPASSSSQRPPKGLWARPTMT